MMKLRLNPLLGSSKEIIIVQVDQAYKNIDKIRLKFGMDNSPWFALCAKFT